MKRLVFGGCLVIVLLSARFISDGFCCGTTLTQETSRMNAHCVYKQDSGKVLHVRSGDLIRIELDALGGAGYSWHIDNLDTEYLELVSEEVHDLSGEKVGGPVPKMWLFVTKKKGTATIRMDHYRIWEGKEKTTEHFSITLDIK